MMKEKELEKLAKLKLKQPAGLKKFIYDKTDYRLNKTCKVSRYVASIEIWHDRLIQRIFAYISFEKEKTMKNMRIQEVCRRVEGFGGCLLKNVYSGDMGGKHVYWDNDSFSDKYFWVNKTNWNFWVHKMYTEHEIIDWLNLPYCQWDEASTHVFMDFFSYICAYRAEPKIELLVKAGLTQYVHCYKKLNLKEKSLAKIFRVNDYWVRYIKDLQYADIMLIRNKKHRIKTIEDLKLVKDLFSKIHNDFKKIHKYASPEMANYISEKKIEYKEYALYNDYLDFCERLNYDLNDKNILCPKNLKKEHDRSMKLVEIAKNEKTKERFFNAYKSLLDYVYSEGSYVIIPCEQLAELENESKELHHCVRTYANSYMDRKTNIMFVRDIHDITKPYATLEFREKRVIQFRSKNNNIPSDAAIQFVRNWAKQYELQCTL